MNNDKFHCPKCKLLFDSLNHLPRILNLCEHTLCSYCINEQLHKTPTKIYCPIDKTLYENISSINIFKENTNLIEELQEALNIPSNHNYEISNEDIFFDKSGIMNSDKFNDTMNSLNLNSSIISSSHCYYKKSKDIRINLGEKNSQICNIHTLPLNVICIDERKKICSQCALNNEHVSHQIITENEFMNNIDNLIDLFQEVDNNQIKYLNFNSINTKSTLDKIGANIDNLIKMINNTKNDIINNIKEQCENIENYLNERKKEIFDKYQSTSFDISTLRESTLNWMQTVTNKLDQLNEIKEPSSECIKLLDTEPNKNIFNLIRNGKQLNGRYNFIQEMLKIIDKLESFDKKGISIKPNKNIIDRIFIKEKEKKEDENKEKSMEKEEEDDIEINLNIDELGKKNNLKNDKSKKDEKKEEKNIKSTLFEIEENKDLINSLHLTQFKFDFYDNKVNENEEKEDINKKEDKNENNKNDELKNKNEENGNNNINSDKNNEVKEKEKVNENENENDNDDVNDIILNLNINEIKNEKENKENDKNKNENNENDNNINGGNDKNNISKIIDNLSFNDDTLLINPVTVNQNDTIYHKKIKNDYPIDLKNPRKKENSILEKSNQHINEHHQTQTQEMPKTIKTKKIDISELNKNNKILEQKLENQSNNNKINNKNIKNSFSLYNNDARSMGNDNDTFSNNIQKKNEVVISFSKRLSGSKKNQPICSNYTKSEKKNAFMRQDGSPILMSRSPGRMISKSKLAGFYSFVPLEKNNKNKIEVNQNKNIDKTLVSTKDLNNNKKKMFADKLQHKNSKNNNHAEEENDNNTEYSSNANVRRTSFCINKNIKKMKTLSKDIFSNSNKIVKKINSTKIVNNLEEQNNNKNEEDKYNVTNFNTNTQAGNRILNNNNNLLNSASNLIINNSSNSFENKTKKELQEFINNQLKNNKPNFSRINMNGYGTQYLCSYLHKNPNINYKEIKLLGCNLNDDDLFILTRTLLDHDIGLLVLNLSSNKITDDSASNILDILKDCKSLKGLSLYNNMISNILKEKLKEYAKLGRKNYEMVQLYI